MGKKRPQDQPTASPPTANPNEGFGPLLRACDRAYAEYYATLDPRQQALMPAP